MIKARPTRVHAGWNALRLSLFPLLLLVVCAGPPAQAGPTFPTGETPPAPATPGVHVEGVPDSALAVYDGGAVYPHDFNEAWWMLTPPQRPKGDAIASRRAFIESIVDRMLIAREADQEPLVLTPAESLQIATDRDQLIQNALFDQLTKGLPEPTDEDVARYRRQKIDLAEIRFVTFKDLQHARSWRSKLLFGTPFSELDAAMAREGTALATADTFRFVAADQIPDTLADLIWSMRPGQVSDVQDYAGQPTLILVRSFKRRPDATPAGENLAIKAELQGRRLARVRERHRIELAERVGRTFDDANMKLLLAAHQRLRPRSDVDSLTGEPVMHPNLPLPVIAPADTARVLARADGRAVTIADYLNFWGRVPPFARPEVREMSSLEGTVDRIALGPALLAEAKARGLDRDSTVLAAVANMREGYAVDHYYRDHFQSKVKVTDAALRKLWSQDPAHYDDRASITPRFLVVDRKTLADSLKAQIAQGASFADLARKYSIDATTAVKGGLAGNVYEGTQENAGLEKSMFATPVGKVGGPERTPQGWVVWRIESAEPGVKRSFDDARWMVERDFKILEADRLLMEHLDALKKAKHLRIFDDRITPTLGRGGPWD